MADQVTAQVQDVQAFWKKTFEDAMGRTNAVYAEFAKLDAKSTEQAGFAVDEMAKIAKESIAYFSAISNEYRRLSLEAMKKSTEMFNIKG
jgi:hypothetical protein